MKQFTYTISVPGGIHGRTALLLVERARELDSQVSICKGDRWVEATRMMALMTMGIVQGDEVTVAVQGGAEEENCRTLEAFFKEVL